MSDSESSIKPKKQSATKRFLKILLQVIFMIVILAALLWYVGTTVPADFKPDEPTILRGIDYLYNTILNLDVWYVALAFLMYFGVICSLQLELDWY